MEDFNELSNQQNTSQNNDQYKYLIEKMSKDMKFVGLFTILYGVLNCITVIGAIIGVPLIFMGMRLRESADNLSIFKTTGDQQSLQNSFEKLYKYFNIQKILIIISIVFIIIYIIVIIGIFSSFGFDSDSFLYSMIN